MHELGSQNPNKLFICEGLHDLEFFFALLSEHNLLGFKIITASRKQKTTGLQAYTELLDALRTQHWFSNVEKLILIADNDTNPGPNFAKVQRLVRKSVEPFGVPSRPRRFKSSKRRLPKVMIVMLPRTNQSGCLETLLLPALCDKAKDPPDFVSPMNEYCNKVSVSSWPITKKSKLKTRILLSTMNKSDPYMSLRYVWKGHPSRYIPLTHSHLNQLGEFLVRV